jgi:plastocyanin
MVCGAGTARRFLIVTSLCALVFAAACGGSSTSPSSGSTSPQGPGIDFTININGDRGASSYSPNPQMMRVGQVVNWHNLDSIDHTVTFDDGSFDSGTIPAGSAHVNAQTMTRAGTVNYHCTIHPGMKGSIVVQ